jgi:hypothetical protein
MLNCKAGCSLDKALTNKKQQPFLLTYTQKPMRKGNKEFCGFKTYEVKEFS